MEIYFNPRKAVYEVYDGNHEDGSEPEYENEDFMRAVTYRMAQGRREDPSTSLRMTARGGAANG